jgi:hypothetical protein
MTSVFQQRFFYNFKEKQWKPEIFDIKRRTAGGSQVCEL